jgi:hypothetical protein
LAFSIRLALGFSNASICALLFGFDTLAVTATGFSAAPRFHFRLKVLLPFL